MLTVQPLNCTLKRGSGQASSTDAMIGLLATEFRGLGVSVADTIRVYRRRVARDRIATRRAIEAPGRPARALRGR